MFWPRRRKKNISKKNDANQLETKQHITFFGKEYDIDILVEIEVSEAQNISNDLFAKVIDDFIDNLTRIQDKIEEYVRNEYRTIIEDYYLGLEFVPNKSKEYQEHLLIIRDYENNTTKAMDIVLRNIEPKYFSIYEEKKGYLFLYMNSSDSYGFDAILSSDIIIKLHDGDLE